MTKSSKGRRPSKRHRLIELAETFWGLSFYLCHGRPPRRRRAQDLAAIRDIAIVQCAGDRAFIFTTLKEVAEGPFRSSALSERWIEFLAHAERGRPARYRTPGQRQRRELAATVRQNALLAARRTGRAS